jgi:hypothetical protein
LHWHQRPPLIVAAAIIVAVIVTAHPHYGGICPEEEKGRKSLFLFMAQQFKKAIWT